MLMKLLLRSYQTIFIILNMGYLGVGGVALIAILSRIAVLFIVETGSHLIQDFDLSGQQLLGMEEGGSTLIKSLLIPFVRWDALYFVEIARSGYLYEQFQAFFPFLPILMRLIGTVLGLFDLHVLLFQPFVVLF